MLDRTLLLRYLRQRAELGERDLFLDELSAAEVVRLLGGADGPGRDSARPAPKARTAAKAASAASVPPARAVASAALSAAPGRSAEPVSAGAQPLRVLSVEAAECTRCRLHEGRRNVVFGEGSACAQLVVVGEAPGGEEDRTGRPFVGPAGKLLDLLLLSAGFARERVYICNVLKCRPPQNRNPLPDEVEQCARYLRAQLDVISPRVLLAAGKFAAQSLAGSEQSIGRLRGRIHSYAGIPLVVTYHPAFLLRSPQWTRTTWEDFQLARKVLDEQA